MNHPPLEIRPTASKGRGLFTTSLIPQGSFILQFQGFLLPTAELRDEYLAMQVNDDLWLCSRGDLLDDCVNHGCDPNAGFLAGETVLHALRDIQPGEEIVWDYSTSIAEPGWKMACRCGSAQCRGIIRPWAELSTEDRDRLRSTALRYLRGR